MTPRVIRCDEPELVFDLRLVRTAYLRIDCITGRPWHWDHNGLRRVLTLPVLQNALAVYDDHTLKHRREAMPKGVGRFTWDQTVSVEEAEKAVDASPSGDAPSGGEAQQ